MSKNIMNTKIINTPHTTQASNLKYWDGGEDVSKNDFFAEGDGNNGFVPNPKKKISHEEMREKIHFICGF